jgi:hypothetical protein
MVKVRSQQQKKEAFLLLQPELVEQQLVTKRLVYTLRREPQVEPVYLGNLQPMTKTQYQELRLDTGVFRPLLVEMK